MLETSLECYLWDLVDEGIDDVLDRVKGEVGVSGICVPVFCPPIQQLRPHAGVSPRTFRSAGGAQFQPEVSRYAGTRMRPVTAEWLRKSNPLAAVGEACAKRGLKLHIGLKACRSPATVQRFPANSIKDVFGDPSPTWLCPANPDVREFLRAMVEDLTEHYPISSIQLEDACFPRAMSLDDQLEQADDTLKMRAPWFRKLCFCESCRQIARRDGFEVETAARQVTGILDELFSDGLPFALFVPLPACIEDDGVFEAFTVWRSKQVTSLLQAIRQACPRHLILKCSGETWETGEDVEMLKPLCDGVVSSCLDVDTEAIDQPRKDELTLAGHISRMHMPITVGDSWCPDSTDVVAAASRTVKLGIRNITFRNYGVMPLSRLEWVHQAVRFARREANSV